MPLTLEQFDESFSRDGMALAGMDEAGRGPVAGPLVAAGVVLRDGCSIPGVNDSKRLSDRSRRRLLPLILESCERHGVGVVEAGRIDRIGMSAAVAEAFGAALASMGIDERWPGTVMIDGLPIAALSLPSLVFVCKADSKSRVVASASILAKVTRDDIMRAASRDHPGYGFERNKGYLTKEHREALEAHGPCRIHRKSFSPVREMFQPRLGLLD